MKKSKLIKMLESIEGDPDIFLWNGFVQDWQDIGNITPVEVERQTVSGYGYYLNLERQVRDNLPPLEPDEVKKLHKKWNAGGWQIVSNDPEFLEHVKNDLKRKFLQRKKVLLIDSKPRGVKTFNRLGDISY